KPLVKGANCKDATRNFIRSTVVWILLYLSGPFRSVIAFAVNCYAVHMFCPNKSHKLALNSEAHRSLSQGNAQQVTHPRYIGLMIGNYSAADFTGMYGCEENDNQTCIKRRIVYATTVAN
ncbi:LOW QUALITY PROTEIN: hypothetical protein ACHAWF_000794, partial [Thalassiosira exigua]